MTGQKQHDTTEFIDNAMRAFWARGYEGTSIGDLVSATGVNRGSIYANFDGKRDILVAALKRYDDFYRFRFLERLAAQLGPKDAVIAAFRGAAQPPETTGVPGGCLIINSAVEIAPHDPGVAEIVTASLNGLHAFFLDRINAAKARGDVAADLPAKATAQALQALFIGLRVLTRSGADQDTRDAIVAQVETMLR
jgi:TetR/AcrR family transcriptional repressor of nem operon